MLFPGNPRLATLLGAVTADAAAMGLHWLYDAGRIKELQRQGPLAFRPPQAGNYAGVAGYFAHEGKAAGENSFYGETCRLFIRHLACHGRFDRPAYQQEWLAYFGPGGRYVGYIDHPSRALVVRLLQCADPADYPAVSGSGDTQLPALECVPALVACHRGSRSELLATVHEALAVTHDHPLAREVATAATQALADVLEGVPLAEALAHAASFAGTTLQPLLTDALTMPQLDATAAATRFGMACSLEKGLPVIFHIARHAPSYAVAVEANILAGGDSCGRSLLLGALMAARDTLHGAHPPAPCGIPLTWLARLSGVTRLIDDARRALCLGDETAI